MKRFLIFLVSLGIVFSVAAQDRSVEYILNDVWDSTNNGLQAKISGNAALTDLSISGDITVIDDAWIGLGESGGKITFNDAATDQVLVENATLDLGDKNITSVGDVALDSLSSTAGTSINVDLGSDAGDDFIVDSNKLRVEGDNGNISINDNGTAGTNRLSLFNQTGDGNLAHYMYNYDHGSNTSIALYAEDASGVLKGNVTFIVDPDALTLAINGPGTGGAIRVNDEASDMDFVVESDSAAIPFSIDGAGDGFVSIADLRSNGNLKIGGRGQLTIATGVITPSNTSGAYIDVDTEGNAASDDLDTVTSLGVGYIVVLKPENDARTVVVKDGTGNLALDENNDFTMDGINDHILLIDNGGTWCEISRSDN